MQGDHANALRHLEAIANRLVSAPAVALIADYDGTLTPIVSQPDLAILSESTRSLLRDLANAERTHVAIVSGRSLEDIEAKVGLDLIYAGNHGLEIQCNGERFKEPAAAAHAPGLQAIVATLHEKLDGIEGVLLENKGLSASVHFRKASTESEARIRSLTAQALRTYAGHYLLKEGKKVIEIRPTVNWNKGTAALWILEHLPPGALPICLGDDRTDEDMFKSLADGITVSVGPNENTAARLHVSDVEEAIRFLCYLREIMPCSAVCGPGQRQR